MDSDKLNLPLVVTGSSGIGGVAPRVTVLPESSPIVEQEASAAFGAMVANPSQFLDRLCMEAHSSHLSAGIAICEALRRNAEQTAQFFDDVMLAKGPAEVFKLQLRFVFAQFGHFADQVRQLHREFANICLPR
jgi:hypothetical protein